MSLFKVEGDNRPNPCQYLDDIVTAAQTVGVVPTANMGPVEVARLEYELKIVAGSREVHPGQTPEQRLDTLYGPGSGTFQFITKEDAWRIIDVMDSLLAGRRTSK